MTQSMVAEPVLNGVHHDSKVAIPPTATPEVLVQPTAPAYAAVQHVHHNLDDRIVHLEWANQRQAFTVWCLAIVTLIAIAIAIGVVIERPWVPRTNVWEQEYQFQLRLAANSASQCALNSNASGNPECVRALAALNSAANLVDRKQGVLKGYLAEQEGYASETIASSR